MRVELLQPYLKAAQDVIAKETGAEVVPGKLALRKPPASTQEVSVLIGVTGKLQGVLMLMMLQETALNIVSRITGETSPTFDEMAQSAMAEMANVISGRAGIDLAAMGYETTISPPTVIVGPAGGTVSTLNIPILAMPLQANCGEIDLQIALKESV